MNGYLLDVNVLLALAWPNHIHHTPAHHWFATRDTSRWATCTVTHLAFVRISSHPSFSRGVTTQDAFQKLRQILVVPNHTFWSEPPQGFADPVSTSQVLTHSAVTDGYLAALAALHGGRLVTFDQQLAKNYPTATFLIQAQAP